MEKVILLVLVASVLSAYALLHPTLRNRVVIAMVVSILATAAVVALVRYFAGPNAWPTQSWVFGFGAGVFFFLAFSWFFAQDYHRYLQVDRRREGFFGHRSRRL